MPYALIRRLRIIFFMTGIIGEGRDNAQPPSFRLLVISMTRAMMPAADNDIYIRFLAI